MSRGCGGRAVLSGMRTLVDGLKTKQDKELWMYVQV